jgi:hypothetical protein
LIYLFLGKEWVCLRGWVSAGLWGQEGLLVEVHPLREEVLVVLVVYLLIQVQEQVELVAPLQQKVRARGDEVLLPECSELRLAVGGQEGRLMRHLNHQKMVVEVNRPE